MNLTYGHLELEKLAKENEDYYEVMICRVAIGKTFIFPTKNITQSIPMHEKPQLMGNEFDSLFIYDQNNVTKQFVQRYLIYRSSENILPLYIVHFSINQSKYRELREVQLLLVRKLLVNSAKIIQLESIARLRTPISVIPVTKLIIKISSSISTKERN